MIKKNFFSSKTVSKGVPTYTIRDNYVLIKNVL